MQVATYSLSAITLYYVFVFIYNSIKNLMWAVSAATVTVAFTPYNTEI